MTASWDELQVQRNQAVQWPDVRRQFQVSGFGVYSAQLFYRCSSLKKSVLLQARKAMLVFVSYSRRVTNASLLYYQEIQLLPVEL